MNNMHADSKVFALFTSCLGIVCLLTVADPIAAQNKGQGKSVILIDGSRNPDDIPDWIQWRELFNRVLLLADKSPDAGRVFWAETIGLAPAQANQLIAHAQLLRSEEKKDDAERQNLVKSKSSNTADINKKLHDIEINRQSRVLELRDSLRPNIGAAFVLRLQSYVRLNIAPTIKVGEHRGK